MATFPMGGMRVQRLRPNTEGFYCDGCNNYLGDIDFCKSCMPEAFGLSFRTRSGYLFSMGILYQKRPFKEVEVLEDIDINLKYHSVYITPFNKIITVGFCSPNCEKMGELADFLCEENGNLTDLPNEDYLIYECNFLSVKYRGMSMIETEYNQLDDYQKSMFEKYRQMHIK